MKFNHDLAITQSNYIAQTRLRAIGVLEDHGWKAASQAFRVSRPTLYRWKKCWEDSRRQAQALVPKSTRPHKPRRADTDPRLVDFIRSLRKSYPRMGKAKVKPLLDAYCQERGILPISEPTVGRIIKRCNLFYPLPKKTRPARKRDRISSRIRAKYPGELIQIDAIVRFEDGVRLYILTAVDIFSRFSFAYGYRSLSSRAALDFYRKLERVSPAPIRTVKTDNGSEFLGEFDRYLQNKGITHFFSYPRTPKSNSFVERFNRTLQEEFVEYHLDLVDNLPEFNLKLIEYLLFFNGVRPHQALAQLTPLGFLVKNQLLSQMSVSYTRC